MFWLLLLGGATPAAGWTRLALVAWALQFSGPAESKNWGYMGFPEVTGPFLVVLVIGALLFWGLYEGTRLIFQTPIYHMLLYSQQSLKAPEAAISSCRQCFRLGTMNHFEGDSILKEGGRDGDVKPDTEGPSPGRYNKNATTMAGGSFFDFCW